MPPRLDLYITGTPGELAVAVHDLSIVAPAAEEWAVAFLRGRGFSVNRFGEPETPGNFCKRVGISTKVFHSRTRDPRARGLFRADWGSGHKRSVIRRIRSTPEFEAFCHDPKALA